MKKLALALLIAAPMAASANTVKVCRVTEAGEDLRSCRMITFPDRGPSPAEVVVCKGAGEAGGPECITHYGVPGWLKKLNSMFRAPTKAEADAAAKRQAEMDRKG